MAGNELVLGQGLDGVDRTPRSSKPRFQRAVSRQSFSRSVSGAEAQTASTGFTPYGSSMADFQTTLEKHYTINDLCDLLSMSFERVRQLVMNEPGVVVLPPNAPSKRRTRKMYRIPESVVQRILRRSTNPAVSIPTRLPRLVAA